VNYAKRQKNQKTLAATYNNIGLLHWNLNQLTSASHNFFEAANIYETIGDKKGLANAYSNIALIFEDQQRPNDALAYARKSLTIRTKIKDSLNIGRSYANIGIFISQKGDHNSGIYYNNLALPYFQSAGNSYGISLCLHNMGTDFHLLNATDSALVYAKKALQLRLELGNKKYIAASYGLLGSIHKTRKEYKNSDAAYRSAAAIYKQYNVQGELWKTYDRLAFVNEKMGERDSALKFLKARVSITDTLHSEDKIAKLYEIEEKYESEKTKRELAESNSKLAVKKQQSQFLIFLIALGVFMASIIGYLLFHRMRINREAKEKELLLQKLEISRELHDNIGSQLTYLNVKLEQLKGDNFTQSLPDVKQFAKNTITDLRSAIWGLSKDITVKDFEMKIASEVQKAQSENLKVTLYFSSSYDGKLNSITAVNALRICQEALQNAVKHAEASAIDISVDIREYALHATIVDNGKGMNGKGSGFGMRSMEQRAGKMGATLTIESGKTGTSVKLEK
jgi:signal transduction histidine kinase